MSRKISNLLFSLFFVGFSFSQNSFVKDSLDRYIDREIKRWQIPGVAVAIIKDTQVVYMKGFGYSNIETKKKVNETTLFQIASNSKAFTGTSLAILEYQKKLSLQDKVIKRLPYFKLKEDYPTQQTTIADLLSHKIGFSTFQSDFLNWGCNMTRKQLIENMRNVTPSYGFREKFGYCNVAFLTAGEIIPAVCDTSWDDFLKYRFFEPLKMTRTSTSFSKIEADENACLPYTMYEGKLYRLARANVDNLGPAASINSCVKDLSNWLIAQVNLGKFEGNNVIPAEALLRTRESNTIIRSRGDEANKNYFETYGLGWFMKDYHGSKVIWHDGGADGFVTTTCFLPNEKIGIVVLTNTDASGFYGDLRDMIIDAYLNVPYTNYSTLDYNQTKYYKGLDDAEQNKWREQADKKEKWKLDQKKLEGEYKNEVYGKVTIKMANGQLEVLFEHHPLLSASLEYLEGNKFLCTYSNPTYGIKQADVTLEKEKVKGITLRVNSFLDYGEYLFLKIK
ncbi:MAG: serine hydrolase [Bacteroidia bacterium]|nr:serine hydrolase [Bacteroidia bacterium]